ncbi:integrase arm-type DNA-binding domain-containing protein [Methylocella silvestris]|uniref:Arm DNA-binding domain-containing protein n=1 Tax=Methylocella silvestris TaxID=199596 RepID=UPI0001725DB7
MPKITKRVIDELTITGKRQITWDAELKGFGIAISSGGARSCIVRYRNCMGRSRELTLGRFGVLTVEQACKAALDVLARVAKGEDPLAARRETRAAPTMNDLFNRYVSETRFTTLRARARPLCRY